MSSSFPSPSFLPSTFCLRLRRGSLAVTCATGLAVSVFMYACRPKWTKLKVNFADWRKERP